VTVVAMDLGIAVNFLVVVWFIVDDEYERSFLLPWQRLRDHTATSSLVS